MATSPPTQKQRGGLRQIGGSLRGVLDPLAAKRGFAVARLIAGWDDLIGPRHAGWTRPEKLTWPPPRSGARTRQAGDAPLREAGGVLVIAVDGPRSVLLQHELPLIIDRVNAFLGFGAVTEVRLVQRPFPARPAAAAPAPALSAAASEALDATVAAVEADGLRDALRGLGEAVLRRRGGGG